VRNQANQRKAQMNYSIPCDEGVTFEVNSLYEALQQVSDKRKARGKRYSVALVLALSVLAKLGGEDKPEGMAEWVQLRAEPLRASLALKRDRLPSAATYRRVLGDAIEMAELEQVVGAFFARCQHREEQLAIDGKTMRGTIEPGHTSGVHLLAVYAVGTGVVLNEVNVALKENEITAAPKVLAAVDLKGKVITGDAMFTQRDLSQQIVEAGGHYLWKVKDNQPTLRADIERLFGPEKVPLGSAPLRTDFQVATTTSKGHGRLEKHILTTSALLNPTSDWPGLGQVFQLVREVTHLKSGKTTREVCYGMTSLPPASVSAHRLLALNRKHWAIENQLHYCRDVTFHEDACVLRHPRLAQAIAVLNNLVLGLLRLRHFSAIVSARRRFSARPLEALALVLYAFT
jgi:predicted transposase YbfD/YdcC